MIMFEYANSLITLESVRPKIVIINSEQLVTTLIHDAFALAGYIDQESRRLTEEMLNAKTL
jgi:hypothetical protein